MNEMQKDFLNDFLQPYMAKAGETSFFGVRIAEMTREQLEALVVWSHEQQMKFHRDSMQASIDCIKALAAPHRGFD